MESIGLVIEMLLDPGSSPKLAVHHCDLGKYILLKFPIGAEQSTRSGGPA